MRFTPEQLGFARAVADFCATECGTAAQREALTDGGTQSNSLPLLAKLGELGWLGVSLPAEYGGAGAGFVDECLFLEEVSYGLAPVTGYSTGLTAAQTYLRWGTEQQKATVVGNLAAGRLEAIALSEPGAGSDLAAVQLRAERHDDRYVLNGQKTWISIAHLAEHLLVLARESPAGSRHDGLTLLMVPASTPGIELREVRTMEAHTVNDVFFTDVEVPLDAVVGEPGRAWGQLMRGLAVERLIIAASGVGAARRSLDDLVRYLSQREAFGRTLDAFQALQHRVADLATQIALARTFVYDVADRIDAGDEEGLGRDSSMAKLSATEAAKEAALTAMQLMGGMGYAVEGGMEWQVRRALAPPIYGGANEVQRGIIAKAVFGDVGGASRV